MEVVMKVTTRNEGEVVVAVLVGEIDTVDSEGLGEALGEVMEGKTGGLVLDFSGVKYIASMGLSILLRLAQQMRKAGRPLVIAAVPAGVKTVLDTVHLGAAIPLEETVEKGVERAKKGA
jgi:anti-sigma B factor antagonist